jgi:DNA-binding transcriptional LysR family regulator
MELRQLEYFVAVAEEQNFTRAAERIHVAQPAVSAQIQRLEREIGQPLLDRSRRAVRLTPAGEAALPYAKAALGAVADMQVAVDELTQLVRGTVTIGTVTSHNVDIPSLLADFHADHPYVEITLSTDSSDALIEKVRTGRLDAAIVSVGPDEQPAGLDLEVATDEAIQAAVCRTDELATRKTIRLTDLTDRVRGQHAAGARRSGGTRAGRGDRAGVGAAGSRWVAPFGDRPGTAWAPGAGMAVGRADEPGGACSGREGPTAPQCRRPCIE